MINKAITLKQRDAGPEPGGCLRVKGCYYGKDFTGTVYRKEPNWENGSFKKSEGVHLSVDLDTPIYHFGIRENLWLCAWVNNKKFHWGYCEVLA